MYLLVLLRTLVPALAASLQACLCCSGGSVFSESYTKDSPLRGEAESSRSQALEKSEKEGKQEEKGKASLFLLPVSRCIRKENITCTMFSLTKFSGKSFGKLICFLTTCRTLDYSL